VAGVGEASVRALAKLEQVLPARLRERAAAIGQSTVPLTGPEPAVDAETLTTIARACRSYERLVFAYRRFQDTEPTERRVEPHRLVQAGYRWYLVARDLERGEWRTYRVDRIEAPRLTGVRFVPRDPPDAAAFVANAVTTAPYRYQAHVRIRASATAVAEVVPPTVGTIEPVDDGTCTLTSGSDSLDALAFHIGMIGYDFTVLGPPELAERMQLLARRLQQSVL